MFLAQFWGWLLIITGIVYLFRSDAFFKDMIRLIEDKGFAISTGFLSLVLGLATVLLHNVWEANVFVLVTIFGWIGLIKGLMRMVSPKMTVRVAKACAKQVVLMKIMLVVCVFLGLWLVIAAR